MRGRHTGFPVKKWRGQVFLKISFGGQIPCERSVAGRADNTVCQDARQVGASRFLTVE